MNRKTIRFADLAIGDHFIYSGDRLVKRELRQIPGDAFPLNACAPDGHRPFLFIGDDIVVSILPSG